MIESIGLSAFRDVRNSLRQRLANIFFDTYSVRSYSQEGEDMILRRVFDGQQKGFFVDIGAHHPKRFSNTQYFYERGWTGINVEPNPQMQKEFAKARPRDINLQCGVADKAGTLKYFKFNEPALNTFSEEIVNIRFRQGRFRLVETLDIPVVTLEAILAKHLPNGQSIDFLTVDVEGLDSAVLRSNDWQQYRPRCVLSEALNSDLSVNMDSEVTCFMRSQGYELFAKTHNTLIFMDGQR